MNIRTIRNEPRRGCGYRKQGGLYMVSGEAMAACGKLPHELSVCPCCGQGIKPARGWTWIDPRPLFGNKLCTREDSAEGCRCILSESQLPERMGLLWIGEAFYKTPQEFLAEGQAQGISRRVAAIPKDFVLGETWVLFAHRKGIIRPIPFERLEGQEPGSVEYLSAIFGCFKPGRIEYVVKDDDDDEKLDRLEKRGITLVRVVWDEPQRELFAQEAEEDAGELQRDLIEENSD